VTPRPQRSSLLRSLIELVAATIVVVSLIHMPPASATPTTDCGNNTALDGLVGNAHPVILIHGWTGKPMQETRSLLEALPDHKGRQFLLFDYSKASTSWPDTPAIARCLATYIRDVSRTNSTRGGDGMVYLVAHSMGGLAIRFALSPAYGDASLVRDVGGVVTIDTPYKGSMWGNQFLSWAASAKTHPLQALGLYGYPLGGARAWQCLATLGTRPSAPDCAAAPPLPEEVRLTQVAGDLSVERSLFGLHAYTYNIGGDGIVSRESQWGSLGADHKPVATQVDYQQVECTMSADKLLDAGTGIISNTLADNFLLDLYQDKNSQLSSDPGTVTAVVSTLARITGAACSHSGMTKNPKAVSLIDSSLTDMIARQQGVTKAADLLNAPVPASCRHTATRLKGYKLDYDTGNHGLSRGFAELETKQAVFGDVTGDGRSDAVVPFLCTAGGVSWPEFLLVYGPGPRLEGTVDLASLPMQQEHADVDKLTLSGGKKPRVTVAFRSYEGAGFGIGTYTGTLAWSSGKPTFDHSEPLTADFTTDDDGNSLGIGYGTINQATDVETWLPNTPPDFADFIRNEWLKTNRELAGSCPSGANVSVDKYSHLGFASGGEGGCGGAAYIWAKDGGQWRTIDISQEAPYCSQASNQLKRAYYVLGIGCYASANSTQITNRGQWPASGQ
jgi:pimeloyl-ACP methyl ester carboxylesterase